MGAEKPGAAEQSKQLVHVFESFAGVLKKHDALAAIVDKLQRDEHERKVAMKDPAAYVKQHGIPVPDGMRVSIDVAPGIFILIFFCFSFLFWNICVDYRSDGGSSIHVTPR